MPSLRELSSHFPALLIDAASSVIQVGCLMPDGAQFWRTSTAEAGVGLFEAIDNLRVKIDEMAALVFCAGPGSILGIRTSAMAIRTWCVLKPRPVFAYSSLEVVAHALHEPAVSVIADARRDTWHCFKLQHGLTRVTTAELSGDLVTPEGFRNWTPLPSGTRTIPYSLEKILPRITDADVFHATDSPDAFFHAEPSYVSWTPQIHRAPGESTRR